MAGLGVGIFFGIVCLFCGVIGIWVFKRAAVRNGINLDSDEERET